MFLGRRLKADGRRDFRLKGLLVMGTIQSYRDLVVWQKSISLVTDIYKTVGGFPSDEKYALASQMKRSAVSIPSNIAEGYGRNSTKDYIRFLRIASGSLYELQTQIQIALNLNFVSQVSFDRHGHIIVEIERMLSSLINKLVKRSGNPDKD